MSYNTILPPKKGPGFWTVVGITIIIGVALISCGLITLYITGGWYIINQLFTR